MYSLLLHKQLSEEKWFSYASGQQVLMIANELNRAANFIQKGQFNAVNMCYERAFELTDLTSSDPKWKGIGRELRRFRELLAEQYAADIKCHKINEMLYFGLLRLSPEAYRMLYPAPA